VIAGPEIAAAVTAAGFTHVVWLPDSHIGTWDEALRSTPDLTLVRVCREGEAVGLAAGLMLGGARPLVMIQCTGFFEAGDAIRNVAHDLSLPLKLLVGVRSERAVREGKSKDNCPSFTAPVAAAWRLPTIRFDPLAGNSETVATVIRDLAVVPTAALLLWAE
jgi:hypothetical protein